MKVGDKVVLSEVGKREYLNTESNPHDLAGVLVECSDCSIMFKYKVEWDSEKINDYREGELELIEVENTLTLNTTYTAMNGTNWTCIHVRENGNAVLDNGISSAEYTSEGWRVDGDSRYDVRWEDEVEEVTWRVRTMLPNDDVILYDMTLSLVNGQPDWSSAKVEGVL